MVTAVAAALESPLRQRQRQRHRLANVAGSARTTGDFELRHWRPTKRSGTGMKWRWVPPEIEIPGGGGSEAGAGYTSLRDIMSSPEYAAAAAKAHDNCSPAGGGGPGTGGSDVHRIRHPLVKHAAYAYLQLTPSAREDTSRRRRRRRGPLCRLVVGCLGFIGAFFAR